MFRETEQGETQYCPMCEEWAEKYERLQEENEELKKFCVHLEKAKEEQHLQWQQRCTENHNEDSILINKYRKALEEIRDIADLIVNDEDKPSCVNDDDCPFNDGYGLDNHCNMNCPYILGKHIQTKISEVLK